LSFVVGKNGQCTTDREKKEKKKVNYAVIALWEKKGERRKKEPWK